MGIDNDLKQVQDELKWIALQEQSTVKKRVTEKGIFGVLVPIGCAVTVGVLANGLYHFYRKNSQKQQIMMRYRVLAQGVTIALATIGIFSNR